MYVLIDRVGGHRVSRRLNVCVFVYLPPRGAALR
jgi:hypothetical protein